MQQTQTIPSFTEFFRKEQDIWVKSIVPGQVSLEFETSPGNKIGICVPYTGDPICLTDRISFDAIKHCNSLRDLCRPRQQRNGAVKPPALQLLTTEQANEHFARKAERRGLWVKEPDGSVAKDEAGKPIPDVQAVMMTATQSPDIARTIVSPPDQDDDDKMKLDIKYTGLVTPRVAFLCHQVSDVLPENERMTADALLSELEAVESTLTNVDFEHIQNKVPYRSIKSWASERLATEE